MSRRVRLRDLDCAPLHQYPSFTRPARSLARRGGGTLQYRRNVGLYVPGRRRASPLGFEPREAGFVDDVVAASEHGEPRRAARAAEQEGPRSVEGIGSRGRKAAGRLDFSDLGGRAVLQVFLLPVGVLPVLVARTEETKVARNV